MKRYKAIIFDFDGVLGKTMEDNYNAWAYALKPYGISLCEEEYLLLEGMNTRGVAAHFLGKQDVGSIEDVVARKEEHYLSHAVFSFYEGVPALVKKLKRENYKLALVTGAGRRRLQKSDLDSFLSFFEAVITADDVAAGKPDPAPFLAAAQALGVPPSECLVVENAPLGIEAAKAAGMDCVAVASTLKKSHLRKADRIIGKVTDLDFTQ